MPRQPKAVITGIRSIDRKLHTLPLRIQKKVVRQSMRSGMRMVMIVVKDRVPVDTGVLLANVKLRAGLKRKRSEVSLDVRVQANSQTIRTGSSGRKVFYPAIVEYKTKDRYMLKSFNEIGEPARRETIRQLRSGVEREIKAT